MLLLKSGSQCDFMRLMSPHAEYGELTGPHLELAEYNVSSQAHQTFSGFLAKGASPSP